MQVKKTIKKNINDEFQDMWHNHIKLLLVQGRFLDLMNIKESFITWRSLIYNLPCGILQFAINASIDTLATNTNLKRWGKRGNSKCELCGGRETLHHILNHYNAMLDRYLWHHNSILSYLYSLALSGKINWHYNLFWLVKCKHAWNFNNPNRYHHYHSMTKSCNCQ